MKRKNLDWKIKIAGEIILFTTYLLSGMLMGWFFAIGETSLEKTASTLSMSVAFILLWAIHRWRNNYLWKIQTSLDGAITGMVIAAARTVTNFVIERTILNIHIDWLIIIGTGGILGWIYGWLYWRLKT
ncbi:MAG: hypothetical protein OHK003_25840 [Anaerolineales bacterium]